MADEITVNISMSCTNGNMSRRWSLNGQQYDQASQGSDWATVTVGFAAEEALSFTDVTNKGWLFMRNLDATNYVEYGPESGGAMVIWGRLEPGELHACRVSPAVTIRAQANTGDCNVDVLLLED